MSVALSKIRIRIFQKKEIRGGTSTKPYTVFGQNIKTSLSEVKARVRNKIRICVPSGAFHGGVSCYPI